MLTRTIPSTGEGIPAVGIGTWENFDVAPADPARGDLKRVLDVLFDAGGRVIDTSPMYARAEEIVGSLLTEPPATLKPFIATKVWTQGKGAGIQQMERSFTRLKTARIDLMQVHNLLDWRVHLDTLLEWKSAGRVRYLGITHYVPSAHAELETVMRAAPWDFVQLDYSLEDRAAERRLLPLAQERGIAVIVNRPLGGGGLIRRLRGRPLPPFATDVGCTSWAALLLKFILAHPAVTCAIPGTGNPEHMRQAVEAGLGPLPAAAALERLRTLPL